MTVRDIREALCLTQAEFAAQLGTSQVAVSRWEKGLVRPGVDYLRRIAALGDCAMEDITPTVRQLKMREVLTREAYDCLTAQERRTILKAEQAKEYSGWRQYPTTMGKLLEHVPDDWWDRFNAQHLGEVMALLKAAFDDGVAYGRAHKDT